ncbi:MAG: B12-binding domain-containing radical SAM protein [Magnetococcus sp. YQC-5]
MSHVTDARKKIVLFLPNMRWLGKQPRFALPYGLAILTTLLKEEYHVLGLDANGEDLSEEATQERLRILQPDAVLISGLSSVEYPPQIHYSMELIKAVVPQTITVLGGVYPTTLGEQAIRDRNIDYIFIGHAEERVVPFLQLVFAHDRERLLELPGIGFNDPEQGIILNPVKTYIGDVKVMVKPDYTLFDLTPYLAEETHIGNLTTRAPIRTASILASYGCPFNCSFCASRTIRGRKVAFRPLEDVFEEIDYLVREYGVNRIHFHDDNLLVKPSRAKRICQTFMEQRWGPLPWKTSGLFIGLLTEEILRMFAKAGCDEIRMAVETGSPRVMKELVRKPITLEPIPGLVRICKEVGIFVRGLFVIGFPGETWEEIRQTFRFAEACDFDLVHFLVATPLPKTDLYQMALESHSLAEDFDFSEQFNGWGEGFITTDEFTPQELMTLRAYEWDRINFSTPEKTAKIAKVYNMTLEELLEHRRATRRSIGSLKKSGD